MQRRHLLMLSGGLPLSLLTSCSVVEATHTPEAQWTQTEILLDVSVSMRERQVTQLADVETVLRSMDGAGESEVLLINENPLAYPPVATVTMSARKDENPDFYHLSVKHKLQRTVPEAVRRVAEALKQMPPVRATAVVDGLEVAARSFRAVPMAPARKRLVILSDMIEDAGGIHLLREDLSPKGRQRLIAGIKHEGRMPDLRDVSVLVAGARSDPRISRLVNDRIELFWQEFFAAAGARLNRDSFTPVLRASLLSR